MEDRAGQGHPTIQCPGGRPRVLIIDDEPLLRRLLRRCLRGRCEVADCEGGDEAVAHLLADPGYDVILCDVMMPVGGDVVYRAVSAQHPALAERFVFLSGAAFAPETQAFLESLPNLRLDKPFDIEAILQAVETVLARAGGQRSR